MDESQLSIFEIEEVKENVKITQEEIPQLKIKEDVEIPSYQESILPYQVGDIIRINLNVSPDEDPETYYYLEGFVKKKGIIQEVIQKPRLQYLVLFGDHLLYLYHEEIL